MGFKREPLNLSKLKKGFLNLWNFGEVTIDQKFLCIPLFLALLLRIPLYLFPEVIHNDGTEYIRHSQEILSGHWAEGKAPPLYPLLIAGVQFITQDYEKAGILVSIISGTLLVLPVFSLGKEIFNPKVGFLSVLFVTVHPFLYAYSGSVLTESLYHFLLAMSVLLGWHAFKRGQISTILLFSFFTAMAYLTRPEAIGFLFILSLWILLVKPLEMDRPWIKRIGIVFLMIFSFLVFSSPYLIQIRKETGKWNLSKKTSLSLGSLSEEEEEPSLEYLRKRKGITLSSLIKHPLPVLGKIGVGLLNSFYKFQQVFNPLLFIFLMIGWFFLLKKKKLYSIKGNLYLLSFLIFFFGFVFPFFFITRRYVSQMISISLLWAAFGFMEMTFWANQRFCREGIKKKVPGIILSCLLVGLFIQGRVIHSREHREIQREVGLWMRENLPAGAGIMSRLPQEAFYAKSWWVRIPFGDYGAVMREARAKGVRYLIIDDEIGKISPDFKGKMREEDLVFIKDFKQKKQNIVIFKLVNKD